MFINPSMPTLNLVVVIFAALAEQLNYVLYQASSIDAYRMSPFKNTFVIIGYHPSNLNIWLLLANPNIM